MRGPDPSLHFVAFRMTGADGLAAHATGRNRPLKGVFKGGKVIYGSYKGRDFKAWVRRNGAIVLNGQIYDTPSGAARAVLDRGAVNGWSFWKYKDSGGQLRPLAKLRR